MKAITRFLDETPRCSDELNEDRATPGTEGTTITPLVIDNAVVEVEPAFYQLKDGYASTRLRLEPAAICLFPGTQVSGAVQLIRPSVTFEKAEQHDVRAGNAYFGERFASRKWVCPRLAPPTLSANSLIPATARPAIHTTQ